MKAGASQAVEPASPAAPARVGDEVGGSLAAFWLDALFWHAEHLPQVVRLTRGLFSRLVLRGSAAVRNGTLANARRILGPDSTAAERERLARAVVANFILFCHDVGRSMRMTVEELFARIESLQGSELYDAARAMRRGAIVVTAHMGSFEVGMAALRRQDARIHVVFRRDAFGRFDRMRSALREKLGVIEAPVDEGWTVWMRLRDALLRDEVVVLQGDRVMPGQKGERVAVLGADMRLPSGPVKLALATGAPIVPVFSIRTPSDGVRLCIEPAITINGDAPDGVQRAMREMAAVIGKYVAAHPGQWLMLHPAWCADAEGAAERAASGAAAGTTTAG